MLLLFLASAEPAVVPPGDADSMVIDLTVPTPCAPEDRPDDAIVVCAHSDGASPYRLGKTKGAGATSVPRAAIRLSNAVSVHAETEAEDLGMTRAQRLMVRFKLAF